MPKSFNDLSKEEQGYLVHEYLAVKRWNARQPAWDGRDYGKYAGKKKAGKPSHVLEKTRGYVT